MDFQSWFNKNKEDVTNGFHLLSGCTCFRAKTETHTFSTNPELDLWCVSDRNTKKMLLVDVPVDEVAAIFNDSIPLVFGWVSDQIQSNYAAWSSNKAYGSLNDSKRFYEETVAEAEKSHLTWFCYEQENNFVESE